MTESVLATEATWNLFETQGRPALLGRTFIEDDARSGAIVLTNRAWRRLYNADPSIVGSLLRFDGRQVRVVGIVAAVDVEGSDPDVYVVIDETSAAFRDRGQPAIISGTGRVAAGSHAGGSAGPVARRG